MQQLQQRLKTRGHGINKYYSVILRKHRGNAVRGCGANIQQFGDGKRRDGAGWF
jgi:hypothetical protein